MRLSKSQPASKIHYSEFQFPPFWHAILALLVTSSLGIAYASAVSTLWGWLLGLMMSALAFWWWFAKGVQILVTDENLQVGKLTIETKYIGAVSALPAEDFLKRIRGGAHRQDVFVLRNVNFGGVDIEIKDERDPFCHWVVTSKHPSRLATTILGRS